jgi:hypothetical protein
VSLASDLRPLLSSWAGPALCSVVRLSRTVDTLTPSRGYPFVSTVHEYQAKVVLLILSTTKCIDQTYRLKLGRRTVGYISGSSKMTQVLSFSKISKMTRQIKALRRKYVVWSMVSLRSQFICAFVCEVRASVLAQISLKRGWETVGLKRYQGNL